MTENAGACELCGVNYKRRDFSVDWLGRIVLDGHRCDPVVLARYQASELLARVKYTQQRRHVFVCRVCNQSGIGTHVQTMHIECSGEYWKEQDRLRAERRRQAS